MLRNDSFFSSFPKIELEYLSRAAERFERQEDLRQIISKLIKNKSSPHIAILNNELREYFSSANKQLLEVYRPAFRIIGLIPSSDTNTKYSSSLFKYVAIKILEITRLVLKHLPILISHCEKTLEEFGVHIPDSSEISEIGSTSFGKLNNRGSTISDLDITRSTTESIKSDSNGSEKIKELVEALVFYYKMYGDYLRYEVEVFFTVLENLEEIGVAVDNKKKESLKNDKEKIEEIDVVNLMRTLNLPMDEKFGHVSSTSDEKEGGKRNEIENLESLKIFYDEFISLKRREINKGRNYYNKAIELGKTHLLLTNHVLLGTVLNYTVFLFEIEKREDEAINFATKFHQAALEDIPNTHDEEYNKANIIMVLLKDNIDGWKGEKEVAERKSTRY